MAHFVLDGSGPSLQTPPDINDWPDITWEVGENVRRVNLDTVTREEAAQWLPSDTLLTPRSLNRVALAWLKVAGLASSVMWVWLRLNA